jgi:hypothetical protein
LAPRSPRPKPMTLNSWILPFVPPRFIVRDAGEDARRGARLREKAASTMERRAAVTPKRGASIKTSRAAPPATDIERSAERMVVKIYVLTWYYNARYKSTLTKYYIYRSYIGRADLCNRIAMMPNRHVISLSVYLAIPTKPVR